MALDRLKEGSQSAQLGILLSASQPQSNELMQKVKMHVRAWDVKLEDGFFGDTSIREQRVVFPNGKRLIALPSNPDTARGYSGDVFLDEFGLHRNPKQIWAAVMTRITRGFKIRVASTFKGLNNTFGQMSKMMGLADGQAPSSQPVVWGAWHGYWVDCWMAYQQAKAAGVDVGRDPSVMRASIADDTIFMQDYCNVPMEDGSDYIPLAMILGCESSEATVEWDGKPRPGLCAGFDVARKRDLAVILLGCPVGPLTVVCGMIAMPHMKFRDMRKIASEVAGVVEASGGRFAIDTTGMGMQLGEELAEEFPCVDQVNFASAVETGRKDADDRPIKEGVKQRMAGALKRRFEEKTILIPESIPLRRSIQSIKRFISPSGAVLLDAQRSEGGHADEFWGLALMNAGLEGPRHQYIPASEGGLVGDSVMGNLMEARF
jgi:phage FluMu gp28-like protein